MSLQNPTRLRIGMHGRFSGKDYRLVGRVVMGVEDGGEIYYWNEFNLEAASGESATLVYEETDRGGEWRLFILFEPEYPMTAADAATKRVGDHLNLTGTDVRVTLRDTSRVYRIEGKAPEGEAVGDVADYFNAEAGEVMQVVSWTGEDVEFYNGINLSRGVVNSAFNLPPEPTGFAALGKKFSGGSGPDSENYTSGIKFVLQIALVIFIFFIAFGRNLSCSTSYESSAVKKIPAGTPPLAVGAAGKLKEKNYRITTHAVVEIAEMGTIYERHEYELTDDYGMKTLLVCGTRPKLRDWVLFEPFFPLSPPLAPQLAVKMAGDQVDLDGFAGTVGQICRSTVEQTDGDTLSEWKPGTVWYGFVAVSEYRNLLIRWKSDGSIYFFRGTPVDGKKLASEFKLVK